ncbi:rRNA maturation RNase YbeY [Mucilaginibacter daejeonensis]|uniref:rRNA maturation RNase YbeY n=1 Tax=Mucilaginibacter daejeonensis TaxID=398049 RepID=UPI001D174F72|nr:rRNA maturation RNase YbeY [Mucilaginibacter daejeonensis]UEG53421.1 rRNA maturation RNase YbeY [Mucilaginibacter daejeonensis]
MAAINFFTEDTGFKLKDKLPLKRWIKETIIAEGHKLQELNFIFCSDAYLLQINQQYLDHDTYTDIVTFDSSEEEGLIAGDIFISVDRTQENAQKFNVSPEHELHRVIIHGVLHLLGYKDKKPADKQLMTAKEDQYLTVKTF